MAIDPKLLEEACDWQAALAGDDPDWEGFTLWLETSADHVAAYDIAMGLDDTVEAHKPAVAAAMPANDQSGDRPPVFRRRGVAAVLAALIAVPGALWFATLDRSVDIRSGNAPTEFALDARTRIALDRNSVLRHAKDDTSKIELASGSAQFEVAHDPSRRFSVHSGDVTIVDIGTRFAVERNGAQTGVSVAEGMVSVQLGSGGSWTLHAGQRALVDAANVRIEQIDANAVALWRRGQLSYRDAPLSQVVREISRYTPQPVSVDPAIAGRHFSGVLTIGDGRALDKNLADFMGLQRVQGSGSVRISDRR